MRPDARAHHVEHGALGKPQIVELAVGDRVAGPLEREEEDGVLRCRARCGAGAGAEIGEHAQLPPALLAVEAAHLGVGDDEDEQARAQAAPAAVQAEHERDHARADVLGAAPGSDLLLGIIRYFFEQQRPVAQLCHGALALAAAGVLGGRRTAAYPALAPDVKAAGAEFVDAEAVVDGVMVSARAWPDHPAWMREFVRLLRAKAPA